MPQPFMLSTKLSRPKYQILHNQHFENDSVADSPNKTGTSKVGAVSKSQNAQKTFKEKREIFDFLLSENVT